jgi:predicted HAD superfamily Cof-like phosphohydrolase
MHEVQRDVAEFHRVVVGIDDPTTPAIRRPELRAELIREEARETVDAIEAGDLVAVIDGLCDLLCVVYGAAAEFGVDLAPFWDEVHRTNMAKVGGPLREDGKRLKPPGWVPPDIAGVLATLNGADQPKERVG